MVERSIVSLTVIIVGVSQVIKEAFHLKPKWIPTVNLILGMIFSIIFLNEDIKINLFHGMIMGLSASGLYDQVHVHRS